jgi:hypothetical protein
MFFLTAPLFWKKSKQIKLLVNNNTKQLLTSVQWRSHVTKERLLWPFKRQLNPICHLLALLVAHHILHVSRIRVNGVVLICAKVIALSHPGLYVAPQLCRSEEDDGSCLVLIRESLVPISLNARLPLYHSPTHWNTNPSSLQKRSNGCCVCSTPKKTVAVIWADVMRKWVQTERCALWDVRSITPFGVQNYPVRLNFLPFGLILYKNSPEIHFPLKPLNCDLRICLRPLCLCMSAALTQNVSALHFYCSDTKETFNIFYFNILSFRQESAKEGKWNGQG